MEIQNKEVYLHVASTFPDVSVLPKVLVALHLYVPVLLAVTLAHVHFAPANSSFPSLNHWYVMGAVRPSWKALQVNVCFRPIGALPKPVTTGAAGGTEII
jgi:hypothetical protein